MNTPHNVELLSPAGNLSCALAAFDAGADAVYCGLKKFNARERTENFDQEEMSKLLAYSKRNGKRVYITFNTLIKENEIESAATELERLAELGPDAVIVQDLGIVRILREYFPTLAIHASTQMGLHNSEGMKFAKELGIQRVILERQTTLSEIDKMLKAAPGIELEMFIHGALCCSVSGTCLLSSWLGGWSGNRGKCKQPCRRRYHTEKGNGFFLSSQDLCMLESLPQILSSGVSSMKIEGRLRRPDYVHNVVSAYRLAMNAWQSGGKKAFLESLGEAKELLTKTCGRKWSQGFYTEQSRKNLIKYDAMGASGQLCGTVLQTKDKGFFMEPCRRIHVGDVIRVQPRSGDEGPAITITKMSVGGTVASRALKGERVFIHSDKAVAQGAIVYKTGESVPDYSKRIAQMPLQKAMLDVEIKLNCKKISVSAIDKVWEQELDLATADKHPLEEGIVEREFSVAATDDIALGKISVKISDNPFLPAAVLKQLRKDFASWMQTNITASDVMTPIRMGFQNFQRDYAEMRKAPAAQGNETYVILPRNNGYAKSYVPGNAKIIREITDAPSPHEELLLPFFVRENEVPTVKRALADFVTKGGNTVRISSLHHLALLKPYPQLAIKTCMPLPVCNSIAATELKRLGVSLAQAWLELGKSELLDLLAKSPLPMEFYRFGKPILLSTHARIPVENGCDTLTDAKGNCFEIKHKGDMSFLTSDKTLDLPSVKGFAATLYDYRYVTGKERESSLFNFECGLS